MGSRSCGGVSMTHMSRTPISAMWSVRGMGVAVSVSTSTVGLDLLEALLVRHAEALLLVDDDQAEVLERHVLLEQPVRADDDVHRRRRRCRDHVLLLLARVRKRESSATFTG